MKQGTIFEDSPISLTKWLPAMWLICGAKNGISSYELGRALGVTQKSGWFMNHRIRLAMSQGTFEKMGGNSAVEAAETYIGGLSRDLHADKRRTVINGRTGSVGKTAVFGLLDRRDAKSRVRTQVVPNPQKDTLQPIKEDVLPNSNVYTDEHGGYFQLGDAGFNHEFVRHAEFYVRGQVHTNGIENFWSLLKRRIKGTYVSVEPFHMFRHL